MSRAEFVAELSSKLMVESTMDEEDSVAAAVKVADELEKAGEAPWKPPETPLVPIKEGGTVLAPPRPPILKERP